MTRSILAILGTAVLGILAAACAHSPPEQAAPAPEAHPARAAPAPGRPGGMMAMCPMSVPGTQVSATDTADGEALTFTTTPDQVAELRSRVHAMADMHNQHHSGGEGGMHEHGMHEHGMHGHGMHGHEGMTSGMAMPPPSRATVEDLANGARILVTPNDAADLQKLQSAVRGHAQHMSQHGCGMMGQGGVDHG